MYYYSIAEFIARQEHYMTVIVAHACDVCACPDFCKQWSHKLHAGADSGGGAPGARPP